MRVARLRRRGANAVEFALILPVLLALLTGIMDYGWVYLLQHVATTAAREGAREGAVTPQDQGPEARATTAATAAWTRFSLPGAPTVVAFQYDPPGAPPVMVTRVRIDTASLIGLVIGPNRVEATAVQRMEDPS